MTTIINDGLGGTIWAIAWLFTIGYLHLSFWRGVLALIVWPYYLGKHFTKEHKVKELEK